MALSLAKDIESIQQQPLTNTRKLLAGSLLAGDSEPFIADERDAIIESIRTTLSGPQLVAFEREQENITYAIENGLAQHQPNLSTPELQLLWATNLLYLSRSELSPIHNTALWRQLLACDDAQQELTRHAISMARDQFNPATRIKWGIPGSMFYFNPQGNEINIDFLMSLIGGFEDTRSIIFHEIGHSKLTRDFSQNMLVIRSQIEALVAKGKAMGLSKEEYTTLAGLNVKWDYIFYLFDEAENSPVNRYSINAGKRLQQDMGHSLNSVEVVIARAADTPLPDTQTPVKKFLNLKRAVRMSLYKNNALFEDTPEGWERIGVRQDWIEALPAHAGDDPPSSAEAFEQLMELCGGKKGMEYLQPGTLDRMKGAAWLASRTEAYAGQRNAIIDEIWERYAEPLIEPLVEQAQQAARQLVEQLPQQQMQQAGQEQQGGDSGEEQDGSDTGGQDSGAEQNATQAQDAGTERDGNDTGSAQENQAGETSGTSASSDTDNLTVDGNTVPGVRMPPATFEEAQEQERESSIGRDEQDDQSQGQTIDSLLEARDNAMQTEKTVTSGARGRATSPHLFPDAAVSSSPKIGDWADYQTAATEFAGEISQARRYLVRIQDKQAAITHKASTQLDLLPEDGDMGRFDEGAHVDLVTKILSGRPVSEDDARRFTADEEVRTPASIDVVIQIDGSQSMFDDEEGWAYTPSTAGMHAACILNEAAKHPRDRRKASGEEGDINVWTFVWGNDEPLCLARPGDDARNIGQAIAGLKESQGWGTKLAPAVKQTVRAMADDKAPADKPVGFTHYITVSDGDIQDPAAATIAIERLLTNCPRLTFDVMVVNSEQYDTAMDGVIKQIQQRFGEARIKLIRCNSPEEIHPNLLTLLNDRMIATTRSQAVPFGTRKKMFEKAYSAISER